ncbi:hypothetical protein [Vibrio phage vB_VibM_10AMN]|uniref:Uncharacterized protein n=1 Tax=Staphylococcus phage vB_VibM_10AMN12 TaxID=3076785 RepID=A0AA96KT73_9CAUD|nr:hypothetical protein [Vibrio phage vB_VibM_10AMN]WNO47553.1 hypothetical protein [Staphylococcus phage vB_VibM_10AMN12]
MAKSKNKIDVKSMSLIQLREALKRASGSQKNKITNEINRRIK